MLCNMGAVVFVEQHAGSGEARRGGGAIDQRGGPGVAERQSPPAHRTTGSDSTTGINGGVGGWREACSFFFYLKINRSLPSLLLPRVSYC